MKYIKHRITLLNIFFLSIFLSACVQDNLDPDNYPGVGGIEDLTPPEAAFSYEQDIVDFTVFLLVNESISATGQIWSIPDDAVLVDDSATLTDENIEVKFSDEGQFSVGLIATDDRPTSSEELVQVIDVVEPTEPIIPTPVILGAGFEDEDGEDGRNFWGRNSSANANYKRVSGLSVFGRSTGSRVRTGTYSAKFEDGSTNLRQAYQEIAVTPNVNYRLTAWVKLGSTGTLGNGDEFRLAVLNQTFDTYDLATFEGAILGATTADPGDDFAEVRLIFNPGDLETVAIYMDSKGTVEVQVDDISIEVL
ncbi:hypothetical protein Q4Q35_11080 [Flavivirga aquimarina]|uniref:CBM-cenC domain-containing protein n=1 Tax=Flavivirga aquimarina TaxID=2027862 RepID=A0ABT8WB23_9FLAO|nr:hypothetical protein [Flavivirga aquimarina]MDO5970348.1 hypothetical protein [Flavivirga aquimarina]